MENWQRKIVHENIHKLIENTDCRISLLTLLQERSVIGQVDIQEINAFQTSLEKANKLYNILVTRTNAYQNMLDCLWNDQQTGAYDILNQSSLLALIKVSSNVIGNGRYSTVYAGTFAGKNVAVKTIKRDLQPVSIAFNEISTLFETKHQNIIKCHGYETYSNVFYIALELCSYNLTTWVNNRKKNANVTLSKIDEVTILRQVSNGMKHLHDVSIIHADIQPENILLRETENGETTVLIADFGHAILTSHSSMIEREDESNHIIGNNGWSSPEASQMLHDPSIKLTAKTDIFSLGCVFYYVLTHGCHPFGDERRRQVNINENKCDVNLNLLCCDQIYYYWLLQLMISKAPTNRPSADEICKLNKLWRPRQQTEFILACKNYIQCSKENYDFISRNAYYIINALHDDCLSHQSTLLEPIDNFFESCQQPKSNSEAQTFNNTTLQEIIIQDSSCSKVYFILWIALQTEKNLEIFTRFYSVECSDWVNKLLAFINASILEKGTVVSDNLTITSQLERRRLYAYYKLEQDIVDKVEDLIILVELQNGDVSGASNNKIFMNRLTKLCAKLGKIDLVNTYETLLKIRYELYWTPEEFRKFMMQLFLYWDNDSRNGVTLSVFQNSVIGIASKFLLTNKIVECGDLKSCLVRVCFSLQKAEISWGSNNYLPLTHNIVLRLYEMRKHVILTNYLKYFVLPEDFWIRDKLTNESIIKRICRLPATETIFRMDIFTAHEILNVHLLVTDAELQRIYATNCWPQSKNNFDYETRILIQNNRCAAYKFIQTFRQPSSKNTLSQKSNEVFAKCSIL